MNTQIKKILRVLPDICIFCPDLNINHKKL